jgi:hypothetical protein
MYISTPWLGLVPKGGQMRESEPLELSYKCCEPPCAGNWIPGPLEEQTVALTTEPSLQPLVILGRVALGSHKWNLSLLRDHTETKRVSCHVLYTPILTTPGHAALGWWFLYYVYMPVLHGQKRAPDLIIEGYELPCGCWKLNSEPLEEQSVLLTTEPSLQPQFQTSTHPHLSSSRRSKTKSSPLLKSWFRLGVRHQHSTLKGLRGNGVIGTKQQEVDFSLLRVTNSWKNGTHLTRCSVKLYYLLALGSCTDVVHQIWLLPTAELGQPPASASLWSICPQLWVGADGKHWLVINYLCLGV